MTFQNKIAVVTGGAQGIGKAIANAFQREGATVEIIDIQRARANRFLPLPINFNDVDRAVVDYDIAEQNKIRLARKDYSYKGDKLELSEAEINKFDVWEKKLLDLYTIDIKISITYEYL